MDFWYEFLDEMCGRDYEEGADEPTEATQLLGAFKGWVAGRYNVGLTRGEVIDAMGAKWRVQRDAICDGEERYLTMPLPQRKRRRAE